MKKNNKWKIKNKQKNNKLKRVSRQSIIKHKKFNNKMYSKIKFNKILRP